MTKYRIVEAIGWRELATFVPNKVEPVYNWLHFKEGFAKKLVENMLDEFGIKYGTVLDPFCGVGTTLLTCKQRGIDSIGLDVLPIALLSSRVKTYDYNVERLDGIAKLMFKDRFEKPMIKVPKIMKRAFSRHNLEDIVFFMDKVKRFDAHEREFFLLGMVKAALNVSYTWKDGGVIKFRKRSVAPFKKMFRRKVYRMVKDLRRFETKPCTTTVHKGDARRIPVDDNTVDAVITSPPYLNNIDYTKVYEIENFIIGDFSEPMARSYVGLRDGKETKEKYFADMELVMKELYRVCKSGAKLAIVLGNGYVNGEVVESDIVLADICKKIGFSVKEIRVLNQRYALKDRTKKVGTLRESMIVLRKA